MKKILHPKSEINSALDLVELNSYMTQFISENKNQRMEDILKQRTNHLTVILEDIYQAQNASAVMRSCECFGIQSLHVIDQGDHYELNPDVVVGSFKWVDLIKYNTPKKNNAATCYKKLRKEGYQLIATSPHIESYVPENLPIDKPTAIIFGNEKDGISEFTKKEADAFIKIPMYGFTESYNISVSAAIVLYTLTQRLHQSEINWRLTEKEKNETKYRWLKNSIKRFDLLETEFCTTRSGKKTLIK